MPQAKFVVLSKELRGQSFELRERMYTIGRVEAADICIPDSTISSSHTEIHYNDGEYKVVDLGSSNGTRVNGARFTGEHELKHSDVLQVGEVELMLDNPNSTEARVVETRTNISLETNPAMGITELSNLNANHKTHKKASPLANKVFLIIALLLTVVVIVMVFLLLRPE